MSGIPFPSMDIKDISQREGTITPEPEMKNSSSTTRDTATSSKLTSSDKLTALPTPRPPPPNYAVASIQRGYRRSLDAALDRELVPWPSLKDNRQGTPEAPSTGKETPKQRVSFGSDMRHSPAHQILSSRHRSSEPASPSPVRQSGEKTEDSAIRSHSRTPSQSQSRSRATSPLRILQQWSTGLHRSLRHTTEEEDEEPFIPIDPFRLPGGLLGCFRSTRPSAEDDVELGRTQGSLSSSSAGAYDCNDLIPITSLQTLLRDIRIFFFDILPRQLYLLLLLRLPVMYFSRVSRIFQDAEVSRPDIERMIDAAGGGGCHVGNQGPATGNDQSHHHHAYPPAHQHASTPVKSPTPPHQPISSNYLSPPQTRLSTAASTANSFLYMPLPYPDEWTPPLVSPALIRFKHSWEGFIDSLVKEWKTLNVVSALLASAIMSIFQVPQASSDLITRTFAVLSLICALMSLTYGCMYIVRFGTMRSMFHASRWAEEAKRSKTGIWWNVWVMLAIPGVWMAWSMVFFITAILSFVWRSNFQEDGGAEGADTQATPLLVSKVLVSAVLGLGAVYLGLIVSTLKKYGHGQGKNPHAKGAKKDRGSKRRRERERWETTPGGRGEESIPPVPPLPSNLGSDWDERRGRGLYRQRRDGGTIPIPGTSTSLHPPPLHQGENTRSWKAFDLTHHHQHSLSASGGGGEFTDETGGRASRFVGGSWSRARKRLSGLWFGGGGGSRGHEGDDEDSGGSVDVDVKDVKVDLRDESGSERSLGMGKKLG